mmetsp:Transcript_5269/g.10746  ORF Transcript_5269/g.10746 Transcript_5269/m.10746 type:complete len:248 (+) Transcript_5269:258-1001(+)
MWRSPSARKMVNTRAAEHSFLTVITGRCMKRARSSMGGSPGRPSCSCRWKPLRSAGSASLWRSRTSHRWWKVRISVSSISSREVGGAAGPLALPPRGRPSPSSPSPSSSCSREAEVDRRTWRPSPPSSSSLALRSSASRSPGAARKTYSLCLSSTSSWLRRMMPSSAPRRRTSRLLPGTCSTSSWSKTGKPLCVQEESTSLMRLAFSTGWKPTTGPDMMSPAVMLRNARGAVACRYPRLLSRSRSPS